MMQPYQWITRLLLLLLATACASGSPKRSVLAPTRIVGDPMPMASVLELPPIVLAVLPANYAAWTPEQIFQAGNNAYDEGEWRDAIAHFDRLIREFPEADVVPAALFNAGLAALHERLFDRAEPYFTALAARFPDNDLVPSALWNLVELREKRQSWPEVIATIDILSGYQLENNDVFEMEARAWIARTMLKPTDFNLDRLQTMAREYAKRQASGQALGRETMARINWTMGEVFLARSQAIPVNPDSEKLSEELENKAALLLKAQDSYMQTVKALDPHWATAAVFRIGFAYESFYSDLVSAPAPQSLVGEERVVYFEEVRNALVPVKQKAELAYERIIRFSKQYGVETDWVKQAETRLARLQRLKLPELGALPAGEAAASVEAARGAKK